MTTLLRSRVVDQVEAAQPVVSMVASVFCLCSAEMAAVNAGLGDHLSPQVSRSLARALCHWTCSYLFPDLSCYEQLSGELGITASRGSDVDLCWTVTYLLNYVVLCMKTRSSESALLDDVLQLFAGLVDTKERHVSLFYLLVVSSVYSLVFWSQCCQLSCRLICYCKKLFAKCHFGGYCSVLLPCSYCF